jgi:hypothetical protein
MAARRPPGRRSSTASGIDEVATVPEVATLRPRALDLDAEQPGPSSDDLDQRERHQSSRRKPAGPKRNRVAPDDVVIEQGQTPSESQPTDPA